MAWKVGPRGLICCGAKSTQEQFILPAWPWGRRLRNLNSMQFLHNLFYKFLENTPLSHSSFAAQLFEIHRWKIPPEISGKFLRFLFIVPLFSPRSLLGTHSYVSIIVPFDLIPIQVQPQFLDPHLRSQHMIYVRGEMLMRIK